MSPVLLISKSFRITENTLKVPVKKTAVDLRVVKFSPCFAFMIACERENVGILILKRCVFEHISEIYKFFEMAWFNFYSASRKKMFSLLFWMFFKGFVWSFSCSLRLEGKLFVMCWFVEVIIGSEIYFSSSYSRLRTICSCNFTHPKSEIRSFSSFTTPDWLANDSSSVWKYFWTRST